jgi:hypothetical protein
MTNRYRLIRLEKVKSVRTAQDEIPFTTINKDHRGHKNRKCARVAQTGGASHSALLQTCVPPLLIFVDMALGKTRRPGMQAV